MTSFRNALHNAKLRLKAAQKKLDKLKVEASDDIPALVVAQSKVNLEQASVNELEKRLLESQNNTASKSKEEVPNTTLEITRSDYKDFETFVSKKFKKLKSDMPQVSFRIEKERYQEFKQHVKLPVSHSLDSFGSISNLTRSLNLADLDGDIHFILRRSTAQLARFLDAAQTEDIKLLPKSEQLMLSKTFINFHAHSDANKAKLIKKIKSIYEYINAVNLYEFIDR